MSDPARLMLLGRVSEAESRIAEIEAESRALISAITSALYSFSVIDELDTAVVQASAMALHKICNEARELRASIAKLKSQLGI